MTSETNSPSTVTVVLHVPWAVSECSTAPESNAALTVTAPRAPASGSRAKKLVIAPATTDRAARKFLARAVVLPTLTL